MQTKMNSTPSTEQLRMVDDALAVLEKFARSFNPAATAETTFSQNSPAAAAVHKDGVCATAKKDADCSISDFGVLPAQYDLNLMLALAPRQLRLQRLVSYFENGSFFLPGILPSPNCWRLLVAPTPEPSVN